MKWRAVKLGYAVLTAVAIAGCGPVSESTAPTEIAVVDSATPTPAPVSAYPVPENLVSNGSVESVDETGRPLGWGISPSALLVPGPEKEFDAADGARTLTLRGVAEAWGIAFCEARIAPGTKAVFVCAKGRAPLFDYLRLSVVYKVGGVERSVEQPWPACPDSWTSVSLRIDLPARIDGDTVRVRVMVRNKPGLVFRIDDVRVYAEK